MFAISVFRGFPLPEKHKGTIVSTTFAFTFPRRVALSAGLRLVAWARRPEADATQASRTALNRRIAELSAQARREELEARRNRDLDLFVAQRPIA